MRAIRLLAALALLAIFTLSVSCGGNNDDAGIAPTSTPLATSTSVNAATVDSATATATLMPTPSTTAAPTVAGQTATPTITPTPKPPYPYTIVAEPLGDLLFTGMVTRLSDGVENLPSGFPSMYAIGINGIGLHAVTSTTRTEFGDELPRWSPDGRRVAFVRDQTSLSGPRIMLFDPANGASEEVLSPDSRDDARLQRINDIVWSPDGTRLLISATAYTTTDTSWDTETIECIYVLNVEDGALANLSTDPAQNDYTASFSPDGTRIAFGRTSTDETDITFSIWTMATDGTQAKQVVELNDFISVPLWSPDGTWLTFMRMFVRNDELAWSTMVIGIDGAGLMDLTEITTPSGALVSDIAESWSRDGQTILLTRYTAPTDGSGTIWDHGQISMMGVNGSTFDTLTPESVSSEFPALSPDGSEIAYMSRAETTADDPIYELRVMRSDGSDSRVLASGISDLPQRVNLLQWRPLRSADPYAYEQVVTDLSNDAWAAGGIDLLGVDLRLDPASLTITVMAAEPFATEVCDRVEQSSETLIDVGNGQTTYLIATCGGSVWSVSVSDPAGKTVVLDNIVTISGSEQRAMVATIPRVALPQLPTLFRWSTRALTESQSDPDDKVPDTGWMEFPIGRGAVVSNVAMLPDAPLPHGLSRVHLPENDRDAQQLMTLLPSQLAGLTRDNTATIHEAGEHRLFWGTQGNIIFSVVNTRTNWFFPGAPAAGNVVLNHATDPTWKVLAAGRDGEIFWAHIASVQLQSGNPTLSYTLWWGADDGDWVAIAVADSPERLDALVAAIVATSSRSDRGNESLANAATPVNDRVAMSEARLTGSRADFEYRSGNASGLTDAAAAAGSE